MDIVSTYDQPLSVAVGERLVIMEVDQEVSQAPSTGGIDRLTPRISKR